MTLRPWSPRLIFASLSVWLAVVLAVIAGGLSTPVRVGIWSIAGVIAVIGVYRSLTITLWVSEEGVMYRDLLWTYRYEWPAIGELTLKTYMTGTSVERRGLSTLPRGIMYGLPRSRKRRMDHRVGQ